MPSADFRDPILPDDPSPTRPGGADRAWLGRAASAGLYFFGIVGMGGMGLVVGLLVGAWKASRQVAALLPKPPLPGAGFAPSGGGLEEAGIWFGNLVVCGVGGLIVGLAIGLVAVPILAVMRSRAKRRLAGP